MAEYIEKEKVIERIDLSIKSWSADYNSNSPNMVRAYKDVKSRLESIPAADVAPVVHENCKFCGGNDNAFHVINGETVAYSGIEIAINRQGMLRVRTYDDYNNRTALPKSTEIVMTVACPNCGAKMDGERRENE